ncbi:AAA family ATPase [Candidatus Woesearchaeota archaeon]|nr:AAA family ATPase [Candidatus Woesearchaeota archaeon]
MSKYYGQSLPYDEKILVRENGILKRVPIGDIVEQKRDADAVCFDHDGKVTLAKISGFIKHRNTSKILNVQTRSGRQIRVTDYHSLFTLGSGAKNGENNGSATGIESVKTSDLIPGKSFIAVPKILPAPMNTIERLDLLEALRTDDHNLKVRGISHHIKKAIGVLGHDAVCQILGVQSKYLYDVMSKNVGISISKFITTMEKADIAFDKNDIKICTKGKSLPSQLDLNEDFCAFLGWWAAEGSYTQKNEVRLSIHRKEEKAIKELCNALFGPVTIYHKRGALATDIYICSSILGKVMQHVLGFTGNARDKKIPDIIYNLPKKNLAAFLRGYFSGDGTVHTRTPAPMVEVCTESPALADDIVYLLLQFGIVAKIYERKNRPQKRICFADYENLNNFREIGFFDSERNLLVYNYLSTITVSRRDRIPLSGDVKNAVQATAELRRWQHQESIGKNILLRYENPKLQKILSTDIYWDKVERIEEIKEHHEYVYDISVEPCQNFVAGFGGIYAHNSEENLRKKFDDAEKNAPSIIFIDEIDAIATKREETKGEVERRVVAQLLALMDGLQSRGKVVVIAATNMPHSLDPALRRPGRFDREIEIGVPTKEGRLNILKIHTRNMPLAKNINLKELARITHGFVGADVSALAKEAAMIVLRRVLPELQLEKEEAIPKESLEKLRITQQDFIDALKVVRPSALREVLVELPNVHWEDIGGLEDIKQEIKEAVEWPLKMPEAFTRLGVRPPKGILLYGPPGTGKTLLAKAVANESEANFILVKGPELLSMWVGESERGVRKVFERARQTSPTIVFFDEIDAIAPRRGASPDTRVTERVVNQLLTEIDGLEELHNIVVIGATNRPDILDTALLRPGRFDRIVLVGAPDEKSRLNIFKIHTKNMPLAPDVNLEEFAKKTAGYAGADIESVCREAAMLALRKDVKAAQVTKKEFSEALDKARPSITKEIEEAYVELKDQFTKARGKEMGREKPYYFG